MENRKSSQGEAKESQRKANENVLPALAARKVAKVRAQEESPSLMDALPEELLRGVLLWTSLKAMNALVRTCKKMSKLGPDRKEFEEHLLKTATERILERLHCLPNHLGKSVLRLLQGEKAILAGSYALQCITDDTFRDCKIKMFIHSRENLENAVCREDCKKMIERIFETNSPSSPLYKAEMRQLDVYEPLSTVLHTFELRTEGITIQFVFPYAQHGSKEIDGLVEYVERKFELDVCKAWFDGERIRSAHVLAQARRVALMRDTCLERLQQAVELYREVWGMMPERETRLYRDWSDRKKLAQERIEKYEARGFKLMIAE